MLHTLLASLLVGGLIGPAVGAATVAAASAVPRVVLIVGPSGAATDRYRAQAIEAAAVARRYTPDVTELYSPNATWPAVRRALQGASVVVYMGHGNGWPSQYRDHLYPPTQNGFGLNPAAGGDDATHQYFGEARIARDIRLASDAVVLLNHLCYASGNSEPGLAEGTLEQARQRVDNFAAGFIAAGASAVVADAHASPSHMLAAVLGGRRSIEAAWRAAPGRNGNAFAFESTRSPGFVAQMDPETATAGFTRSLVLREGLASADVLRGGRGSATAGSAPVALAPSLAEAGLTMDAPRVGATTAGSVLTVRLPFTAERRSALPATILASARWDPLDVAAAPPAEAGPPDLGLVVPERLGDVIEPVKVKVSKTSMSVRVPAPVEAGRYRLTIALHDADGVAFDAATQALVPALLVRLTGEVDAQIVAPPFVELAPGAGGVVELWVANVGIARWGHGEIVDAKDVEGTAPASAALVTGSWLPVGGASAAQVAAAAAASVGSVELPAGLEPRVTVPAALAFEVPAVAGDYLLVLDVVTPEHGSVVAAGAEPTIIRVRVGG